MKTRVAIYGFGRLGRAIYHIASRRADLEVVMVVSEDTAEHIVDALTSDAVYASLEQQFEVAENGFHHEERHVHIRPVKTADVWQGHDIDIVIDTLTDTPTKDTIKQHQAAGAKRVVFAEKTEKMPVVVLGSNEDSLKTAGDGFSGGGAAAAATTPVVDILDHSFGVDHELLTVIDGMLCGGACTCDDDCECCAAANAVPAPVLVSSLADLTVLLKKPVSAKVLNDAIQAAVKEAYYQGIVSSSEAQVAPDAVIGESISALVDLTKTTVDGPLASVKIWYDREWAYANRLVELTADYGKVK